MKNSFRKIMALLMAIMMLAALGMSASAASYSFNEFKKLAKAEEAYAPNTTYTFTVEAIPANENANGTVANPYAGPADAVTIAPITSAPAETDIEKPVVESSGTITVDISNHYNDFKQPGVYRYTVKEENGRYAGITYTNETRVLDVYIADDGTGELKVAGCVMYKSGANLSADNKYDNKGGFENTYTTYNLSITKKVDGNLGDRNKSFNFTVEITGAEGEWYYVTVDGEKTADIKIALDDDEDTTGTASANVQLKDGQTAVVYGLSTGDSYKVTETDYSGDGYITQVDNTAGSEASGTVASDDVAHTFTNTKQVEVPTGVAMDVLPFVAMIVVAGVLALLFFRKKERREA